MLSWTRDADRIYQQEQTALIQTMAQDLNGSFTDRMEEVITNAARPIQKSLQEFVEVNTQQQMRLIDKVAGRFVERLYGMLDGQFKNLAGTIESTCQSQQRPRSWCSRAWTRRPRAEKRRATAVRPRKHGRPAGRIPEKAQTTPAAARTTATCASPPMWRKMELVATQQNAYLKSVSSMHAELSRAMQDCNRRRRPRCSASARSAAKAPPAF